MFGRKPARTPERCGLIDVNLEVKRIPEQVSVKEQDQHDPALLRARSLASNERYVEGVSYSTQAYDRLARGLRISDAAYVAVGGILYDTVKIVDRETSLITGTCPKVPNGVSQEFSGTFNPRMQESVFSALKSIGQCATCPYFGMDPLQAERYRLDLATTRQAAIQAENELDSFLHPQIVANINELTQ